MKRKLCQIIVMAFHICLMVMEADRNYNHLSEVYTKTFTCAIQSNDINNIIIRLSLSKAKVVYHKWVFRSLLIKPSSITIIAYLRIWSVSYKVFCSWLGIKPSTATEYLVFYGLTWKSGPERNELLSGIGWGFLLSFKIKFKLGFSQLTGVSRAKKK